MYVIFSPGGDNSQAMASMAFAMRNKKTPWKGRKSS
jgi:hypothetical protein